MRSRAVNLARRVDAKVLVEGLSPVDLISILALAFYSCRTLAEVPGDAIMALDGGIERFGLIAELVDGFAPTAQREERPPPDVYLIGDIERTPPAVHRAAPRARTRQTAHHAVHQQRPAATSPTARDSRSRPHYQPWNRDHRPAGLRTGVMPQSGCHGRPRVRRRGS